MRSHTRAWLTGLLATVMALGLAGCGQPASAAAVVGDTEITLAEIDGQLKAINEVLNAPADAASVELTAALVRNNIVYTLVEKTAADLGATVTQTEVDERLADQTAFIGGEEQLWQQAAQLGIPPELIITDVRVSLLSDAIVAAVPGTSGISEQEQQQLLVELIQAQSEASNVEVNPRFGYWDVASLSIIPDPDAPAAAPGPLSKLTENP